YVSCPRLWSHGPATRGDRSRHFVLDACIRRSAHWSHSKRRTGSTCGMEREPSLVPYGHFLERSPIFADSTAIGCKAELTSLIRDIRTACESVDVANLPETASPIAGRSTSEEPIHRGSSRRYRVPVA